MIWKPDRKHILMHPFTSTDARFSECKRYRYNLSRSWGPGRGTCTFIMLNPSTATADILDPTVRRCVGFAQGWGYQHLEILNLFALRSTKPKVLYSAEDPIGPDNDAAIVEVTARSSLVVCAWGNHGVLQGRGKDVREWLIERGVEINYLKITGRGEPGHPLYLPSDLKPSLI